MRIKKRFYWFIVFIVIISFGCDGDGNSSIEPSNPTPTPTPTPAFPQILVNGSLVEGFGMGVDDALQSRNWVSQTSESLKIAYPGGLDWGAVFITVGKDPVPPPRPSKDVSSYTQLEIEMKGASGGECVKIGMKDSNDADDGTETQLAVQLTADWKTYPFNLSEFATCQLSQVYVVTEFVFPCPGQNQAQTIDVRTIRFLR